MCETVAFSRNRDRASQSECAGCLLCKGVQQREQVRPEMQPVLSSLSQAFPALGAANLRGLLFPLGRSRGAHFSNSHKVFYIS